MKHRDHIRFACLGSILAIFLCASTGRTAEIRIHGDQDQGPGRSVQGFLIGIGFQPSAQFDEQTVAALKPRFWRVESWEVYDKAARFQPKITFVLADQYVNQKGGWSNAKPWLNWAEWEAYVRTMVTHSKNTRRPVDYWDVWGEPDVQGPTGFWQGTYTDLLELYKRTYDAVRSVDAAAKIIGPSVSNYVPGLAQFVIDLDQVHNVRLHGISWHELGTWPEDVSGRVADFKTRISTSLPSYQPEIHINEFSAENNHLIPGWTVGWLYYLEKAQVDWASRACWTVHEGGESWTDCRAGLNGLLLRDNKTPQHIYWVHRRYAEMLPRRLLTSSPEARTVALASKDDQRQEVRVLVGRYESGTSDCTVTVDPYPYGDHPVDVILEKIPNQGIPGALAAPQLVFRRTVPVANNRIAVSLPAFQSGEAYSLTFSSPAPQRPTGLRKKN